MRVISFFLPQYHPISENDEWWGSGFTDWQNVASSQPRYKDHYQPHIPADLGFYDLRLEETRIAQANMASSHGLGGFCYYHYWFNGKMLLERPFNEVLDSGNPDFPFCLCWANENWTRRWDGRERDVLIEQEYDTYNCEEHIDWLSDAFRDKRYIRIDDRPLFLVYNASAIPNISEVVRRWREAAKNNGFPDIFLCSVMSSQNTSWKDMKEIGFDASVEFYPRGKIYKRRKIIINSVFDIVPLAWYVIANFLKLDQKLPLFKSYVAFSYEAMAKHAMEEEVDKTEKIFPCVMPSWDNSARRKAAAMIIENHDSKLFGKWLAHALNRVSDNSPDEQIVFINAWNEWAEGCHLEPDKRHGREFLEETSRVIEKFKRSKNG